MGGQTQQPTQNVFQQAAGAYGTGVNRLSQGAAPSFQEHTATDMAIDAPNNPVFQTGVGNMEGVVGTPAVQRTMNQYLNPYQNQVIDNLVTRMRERRDADLNLIRGQANQAGAYGGSRQGLVEAETLDRYGQAENEAITQALQGGFDRAAQLGQGQQGLELSQAQALANAGLASSDQQLAASRVLASIGQGRRGRQISAGQSLVDAAQAGQALGTNALNQQMQAGQLQQALNQQLLDRAAGQYDAYVNYPQSALSTAMAGVYGNPLQNAGTTSGVQSTTPGLFDWMSLGAGLGSSYLRGPMGGK